jgi:predicted transcriptional regulator
MMTGEEYKASLFDGRATFFEGKRVDDIPAHPYLGPPAERVARDYDWLLGQAVDGHSPISGVPTTQDELRGKVELVHHAGMMAHVTYTSIMTMLGIMEEKRYVTRRKKAGNYVYSAKLSRKAASRRMLRDLVDRVFDGSAATAMVNLLETSDVDADELRQLRELIQRKAKER